MMRPAVYFWKQAPFLRILPGLLAGIILHWYSQPSLRTWIFILPLPFFALFTYSFIPHFRKYAWPALPGVFSFIVFTCLGGILTWNKDARNDPGWFANKVQPSANLIVTISGPLIEKEKTWRADANVNYGLDSNSMINVSGKIIIYFNKDNLPSNIGYGTQVMLHKAPEPVKGPTNPGAFDYKRYCLFQGITHQIYLRSGEYEVLPGKKKTWLREFILSSKEKILQTLRDNIRGDKEAGLAEALLLGYRNDLDKSLVQTYSNTGVVHIIAVSGLHLGLIYMLLLGLLKPLRTKRHTKWLSTILIIAGLWLFSLLAGAQASILRSALMFTCIVIGESLGRKTSIFNSIAASAFILACIDPFIIWDVGFQLSYAAVASIVIFMRPVYNLLYFKNPLLDMAWKLNAVTIAAQVLTVPLTLYYFHQFPTWFIITNFVAVPLSSAILLAEIFLCAVSFLPSIAQISGNIITWMIGLMNNYVEWVEKMPYSLLGGISITVAGCWLLYFLIAGMAWWLIHKSLHGLKLMLGSLFCFLFTDSYELMLRNKQQFLILYDIPGKTVIDYISRGNYWCMGDGSITRDENARKFCLEPARLQFRVQPSTKPPNLVTSGRFLGYGNKRMLFYSQDVGFPDEGNKLEIDVLIVSGRHRGSLKNLWGSFSISKVVLDSSVPAWLVEDWQKDCAEKNIPFHSVSTDGAFVMNP